eukprot:PhM_4_TR8326/c0_g1_i1/m.21753/K13566/NIT2; omega-amidase
MLRICLAQIHVGADKAANVAKAVKYIGMASKGGADVVVLPECFNCPYGTKYFPQYAESIPDGPTSRAMSDAAKAHNVMVIAGSIPERCDGDDKCYNTCAVYKPSGEFAGAYRKMHLFRIFTEQVRMDEGETLSPGSGTLVVEHKGFRIGLGICFDIRFPTLALHYARELKTDMIVYPGAFNMVTGPAHWRLAAQSRAMDAQQYVAVCAPARDNAAGYVSYGHSLVSDPWAEIEAEAGADETLVFANVRKERIESVRGRLPIFGGYRSDLYDVEWKEGGKSKL